MTREDIEQWIREVGDFDATAEFLAKFATIVASAEREAIIKLAEDLYYWDDSEALIKAIRARGQA